MSLAAFDHRLEDGTPNHIRDRAWPEKNPPCRCPTPIHEGRVSLGLDHCRACGHLISIREGRD